MDTALAWVAEAVAFAIAGVYVVRAFRERTVRSANRVVASGGAIIVLGALITVGLLFASFGAVAAAEASEKGVLLETVLEQAKRPGRLAFGVGIVLLVMGGLLRGRARTESHPPATHVRA